MEYKKFIVGALEDASKIALKYFGKVSGVTKPEDNNQVLTTADLAIGKKIISLIQKKYPAHNIIDEEAGVIDNKSEFTWVIDPIDGTSNFAEGVPNYGIILGLLKDGAPIAGGVALPPFNEIYFAEKNCGAFCNNKKVLVSKETKLLSSLLVYKIDGHRENPEKTREECGLLADIVLNIRNLRISGSVFDAAMVAKGKFGAYLNLTSKIWDNVGAHILIEEAGGVYTDFFGKPMDYSNPVSRSEQNFTWCATTPELHKQIQEIINKF